MAKQVCCKCSSFLSLCFSPHARTHPSSPSSSFSSYRGITAGFCFHCRDAEAPHSCFPSTIFFSLNCLSACLLAWLGACLFVCCVYSESYLSELCLLFSQIGSMQHPPLIFPLACRWSLLLTSFGSFKWDVGGTAMALQ
jgi:hypothetical protein